MTIARKYEFRGKFRTVKEIANILSFPLVTVYRNIRNAKGEITDEILSHPPKFKRKKFMFHGEPQYLAKIATVIGIDVSTLYKRLESTGGKVTETTFLPTSEYNKYCKDRLKSDSGKLLTDIAFESNLDYHVVHERYRRGHRNDAILGAKTPNYNKEYGIIETSKENMQEKKDTAY